MIPSIGKQKIEYCDHKDIRFESLDFYVNLAKKIISKMGKTFFDGLSKEMLKNEDAIAFVANSIMMADWRWKQNTDSTNDKTYKNLYSYRNQCGIWAIKTYVTKKYKDKHSKKKIKTEYSINYTNDDLQLENVIPDKKQKDPLSIIIENERQHILSNNINSLLNISDISDKQKKHILLYYYENMTLEEIGRQYNVTREAIRQSIKSAISKIKKVCSNEN